MSVEFVHTGQCTITHHQYYQMVDLLIECCRKSMGGLNPHTVPCAPSTSRIVAEDSANTKKKNNNNVESSKWNKRNNINTAKSSKWNACRTKKERRHKNNNKNIKEINNKKFSNRFSRLQELVQDNHEVMDMLEKAVDDTKHANSNKEKEENKKNMHDADAVDTNALDAETQKYVEYDKKDNNKNNETSENKENIEKDENNDNNEGSQDHAD